ncbi:TPM domain-containing protein [Dongia sp.]|uniref:TPM domain-containing protein n=1 Tax=Dongia sp. TaxID=1977262 RepID=UPI00375316AA
MIDDGMRDRIAAAIQRAEQGTRAELVAAIAQRADSYRSNALAAALAAALIAGLAVWALLPWPGPVEMLAAELVAFLLVYVLIAFTPFGVRVVPAARKRRMASRLARLVFLERGLASTEEHCGVLFFVSAAEHYVEIIADRGIDRAVEPGAWEKIVAAFTAAVKKGEVEQGFIAAIDTLGALLAKHYPADGSNPNRIPDRLIEL